MSSELKRVNAVLVLAAAVALLAVGCGGGGSKAPAKTPAQVAHERAAALVKAKKTYIKQMTALGKSLSKSLNSLTGATTAKSEAAGLAKAQTDLRAAVKKLDTLSPPAKVKAAHEQLSTALGELADELDPVLAKAKGGKFQPLTSVMTLKGLKDIQTAAAAITAAGFDIGG
jgi:hypothetical protein